jgi:D-alanine-D-alanine ligase
LFRLFSFVSCFFFGVILSKKLRVGVIFGGRSGEHEVSLRSAESIINALDRSRYEVIPIAITKQGKWLASSEATKVLPSAVIESADQHVAIFGDPTERGLRRSIHGGYSEERDRLDCIIPVLHGTYGEDGTIQGLLEMADVPYVGCGVLASAVGMDKVVMKRLFREAGLPVVNFIHFLRTQWEADPHLIEDRVIKEIGLPCFIKPANLGSSVGISKATEAIDINSAIACATKYDRKIIVEQGVDARELEVSVLGNERPVASLPGEIVTQKAEFYDYKAKYIDNDGARLIIPAELSPEMTAETQQLAIHAFQAIDGSGLARVDLFLERKTSKLIVNEINTMPGFTSISMYPKLWEASGISYSQLIDRLIELAFDRHREKSRNVTSYG